MNNWNVTTYVHEQLKWNNICIGTTGLEQYMHKNNWYVTIYA